ncbi:hypothetical protein [Flavobacterium cerinum]|uniref:Lipoprotein n=1 Tax=Flavobacterium cerinum TaxID=2502784 RepID=A0A444HAU9_9FLAO|nr:hypothetical protein [Flavobacterium cerinum]RWX00355.1 hypothetical protein EPI11_08745 [Flavobacterium cerinum]
MKKTYLLFILSLFIVSCSSDDDNGNNNNPTPTNTFLPSNIGNYWVYDVQNSTISGRDSLYVANDTIINGSTFQKLRTKDQPFGFFSNALNKNAIRYDNGKIYLTGNAGLDFAADLPINIAVSNFIIFDQNAAENTELGTVSGTLEQEIEGFKIKFNYKLTSKTKATLANYTSGQQNYSNVRPVEITLNLEITAGLSGFPIAFPLLKPQNVVVSTQYYAENIGVVNATTDINYELEEIPLPDFQLPIPQSGTEHQVETLVNYNVD